MTLKYFEVDINEIVNKLELSSLDNEVVSFASIDLVLTFIKSYLNKSHIEGIN